MVNDVELDPVMKEGLLFVLEDTIRNLTNALPDLEGLIVTHITGKAMRTLVFLLQKASEVTRLFNKQKSGSRARERVKILENLNTVLQNPDSSVHEIEEAEVKLNEFDEEDIRQILQKNENYQMFDDERSSKRFLTLENSKSSYNNNVSHLEVEEEIIDNTTDPPTTKKVKTTTTDPKKILKEFTKKIQAIYDLQPDVNGAEDNILNFLNSDGNKKNLDELLKRKTKITEQEFHEM